MDRFEVVKYIGSGNFGVARLMQNEKMKELVAMKIYHRDLKLENTLLDDSPPPQLKICDFGYSRSSVLHSRPKSTVGTPAYIAPEVLSRKEYDGKLGDVWSCGVTLYVMLVRASGGGGSLKNLISILPLVPRSPRDACWLICRGQQRLYWLV